jgi:hypothetical protein
VARVEAADRDAAVLAPGSGTGGVEIAVEGVGGGFLQRGIGTLFVFRRHGAAFDLVVDIFPRAKGVGVVQIEGELLEVEVGVGIGVVAIGAGSFDEGSDLAFKGGGRLPGEGNRDEGSIENEVSFRHAGVTCSPQGEAIFGKLFRAAKMAAAGDENDALPLNQGNREIAFAGWTREGRWY